MKVLFYTVIGPLIQKNYKSVKRICGMPLLNICGTYTVLLGILGAALSFFDVTRIVSCGPVLTAPLCRNRIKSGRVISPECERDVKLMVLVVSFEYYSLLILGTLTQNPVLFLPWLIFYAIMISSEFTLFILKLCIEGLHSNKNDLVLSMFVIFNWVSVFCAFLQLIGSCDV